MDEKVVQSYQAKFTKKENDKTMSMKEKLEHRDDKDLSPFSADSIGCTICDHHLEDKQYTAKISQFSYSRSSSCVSSNITTFKNTSSRNCC